MKTAKKTKNARKKEKPVVYLVEGDIIRGTDLVNPFNNHLTCDMPLWCKVHPEYVGKPYNPRKYLPMKRK